MLGSVLVRRSQRVKNVQSNQKTILQDSSTIKQEKDMLVRQKCGRQRKLISKEIKCQQTNLIMKPTEIVYALSSFKQERNMLVFCRKPRKQRKSTGTSEVKCNEKGECSQVNYLIGGTAEPSDIIKQNETVRDGLFNHPIWRGSISVSHELGRVDGLAAYMSSRAGVQVSDAVQLLPALVDAQVLCRKDVWPAGFNNCSPTADIIDLYILPADERSEGVYDTFLNAITKQDVVLRAVHADVSVLIFSSLQLTYTSWRTMSRKYYLWAVLEGVNSFFPHRDEDNDSVMKFGCDVSLYLTDELQPFTENETKVNSNRNPQEDRERMHGVNLDNTMLPETENHPIGRAANSDLAECGSTADIRTDIVATETTSIDKYPQSASKEVIGEENYWKNSSAIPKSSTPNVTVYSESMGPSVLEMANTFDDVTYAGEISSAYSVEPKYARILRAILEKHGDITRHCPIKCTKLLTSALEKICETVQDLETLRFVNLRRSHLRSMLSAITDAELVKLDVKWLRKRYDELEEAIGQVKDYKSLKDRRGEMEKTVAVKKKVISWKKDEIVKLQSEIEMAESEVEQITAEKETVSRFIRNVTSKCKHFCLNSLMDGLL